MGVQESTSPVAKISSTTTTPKPDGNVCNLDIDYGDCESYVHKWYFDRDTKRCNTFVWGGCGGNGNRFNSQSDCLEQCLGNKSTVQNVEEESTEPTEDGTTTERSNLKQAQLGWYIIVFLRRVKLYKMGAVLKAAPEKFENFNGSFVSIMNLGAADQ